MRIFNPYGNPWRACFFSNLNHTNMREIEHFIFALILFKKEQARYRRTAHYAIIRKKFIFLLTLLTHFCFAINDNESRTNNNSNAKKRCSLSRVSYWVDNSTSLTHNLIFFFCINIRKKA
jgi:hypothetical protein